MQLALSELAAVQLNDIVIRVLRGDRRKNGHSRVQDRRTGFEGACAIFIKVIGAECRCQVRREVGAEHEPSAIGADVIEISSPVVVFCK